MALVPYGAALPEIINAAEAVSSSDSEEDERNPKEEQRLINATISAYAHQRGLNFRRYVPEIHDRAILQSTEQWCGAYINPLYIQGRLMQLRDEMKYIGTTAEDKTELALLRQELAATGYYNAADPVTLHRRLQAWVLETPNAAQRAILPTASLFGIVIWHGVNFAQDYAFCDSVPDLLPAVTAQWTPQIEIDFSQPNFQNIPPPERSKVFRNPNSTTEIAVVCAQNDGEVQNFGLGRLLLAFALGRQNTNRRTNSVLVQLGQGPQGGNDRMTTLLDLFGFGRVNLVTPTVPTQPWLVNGDVGECVQADVWAKFGAQKDNGSSFLLTLAEAQIILDLTRVQLRGVSCSQPGSLALELGYDPRTGKVAYANNSEVCQAGNLNAQAAGNFEQARVSLQRPAREPQVPNLALPNVILPFQGGPAMHTRARRRRASR